MHLVWCSLKFLTIHHENKMLSLNYYGGYFEFQVHVFV